MDTYKILRSQYLYYALIGVVSFATLAFIPFLGTSIGGTLLLPTDAVGWMVWGVTKGIGAVVNMLIFHFFIRQAKLNIKDNPDFIEALKTLSVKTLQKERIPTSPARFFGFQYGFKGSTVMITSVLSAVALTQAVVVFDYVALLTYVFVIAMGIVFGLAEMKKVEAYWTEEFPRYVHYLIRKEENNV